MDSRCIPEIFKKFLKYFTEFWSQSGVFREFQGVPGVLRDLRELKKGQGMVLKPFGQSFQKSSKGVTQAIGSFKAFQECSRDPPKPF